MFRKAPASGNCSMWMNHDWSDGVFGWPMGFSGLSRSWMLWCLPASLHGIFLECFVSNALMGFEHRWDLRWKWGLFSVPWFKGGLSNMLSNTSQRSSQMNSWSVLATHILCYLLFIFLRDWNFCFSSRSSYIVEHKCVDFRPKPRKWRLPQFCQGLLSVRQAAVHGLVLI